MHLSYIRTSSAKTLCFVLLLVAFVAHLVLFATHRADAASASRRKSADPVERAEASAYLGSLNGTRTASGLPPLSMSSTFSAGAENHAEAMGQRNQLFHASDINSRCSDVGAWGACAENVGMNVLSDGSVSAAASNFMNSSGHRNNILNARFDLVGIGVEHANGQFWIVVRFMDSSGDAAPVAPQKPVPQKPAVQAVTTTRPLKIDPVPASPKLALLPMSSVMFEHDHLSPVSVDSLEFIETSI